MATKRRSPAKRRKLRLEPLEPRLLLSADLSLVDITLVRYFDLWEGGTIRSTDAAGLTYHPESGHLYIADSEINEIDEFVGHNIFAVSLNGDTVHRQIASNNSEPTGITYNEFDGYFYVTNDDDHSITRYDNELNSPLATVDTRDAVPGASDPEGITSDPATGMLYVVDGKDGGMQVLVYDTLLQFQYRFSIASEMSDGEGIALDPDSGNLFIASGRDNAVFEYALDGTFLKKYGLGGISPQVESPEGLVFAPTSDPSDDPKRLALYIADAGEDNYPDGRIFETVFYRPAPGVETLDVPIAASSDDAEERESGGVSTTSSDLELVHDNDNQTVGLRFTGLNIPQGASILNAYVQFHVDEATSGETSLVIQAESVDDALTFSEESENLSSRPRTSASVPWSPPAWNTTGKAGPDQRTPDIAALIQEIVNRPDWAAGNALALLITGTGSRVAESYDGKAGAQPLLRLAFTVNQAPVVDAGADQTVLLPDGANLAGTLSDDGLPKGTLTNVWSQQSGPGAVTFADARSLQTTASFSAAGTYVLRLTADDGQATSSDDVTITVLAETAKTETIEVRVAASSDDAEEREHGWVTTTSSDLELVYDTSNQIVGIRFVNLEIPAGAAIVHAYVQFQADERNSGATSLVIQAESVDDALTFSNESGNLSSRQRTSASVPWSPAAWNTTGEAGSNQRTPDIADVIKEIVNRPGWAAGNALALLITGTGERVAEAYDGKTSAAPLLHVEFSTGDGATNEPPQVDAGEEQWIMLSGAVTLNGTADDDDLPDDSLATNWSVASGPGAVTFADAGSLQTTATFSAAGTYMLRLTAGDGQHTSSADVAITVLAETTTTETIEVRVAASSDDAEERENGWVTTTSSDLELVYDKSNQTVGIRFVGLEIPAGAAIVQAYVQFQADEKNSGATSLVIQADSVDDALTFSDESGNLSSRQRTSASVSWSPAAWTATGEAGSNQRTPDIAAVIKEIVNRPGWAAGNALALLITGTGERVAEAYDGKTSAAPLLHVEFSTGGGARNEPPQVDAGVDQTIMLSGPVTLNGIVNDDDLPDDSLAINWSVASGPGAVIFADASSPQTTATFSVAGTYVLRLTVYDGELTSIDEVTITVLEDDVTLDP